MGGSRLGASSLRRLSLRPATPPRRKTERRSDGSSGFSSHTSFRLICLASPPGILKADSKASEVEGCTAISPEMRHQLKLRGHSCGRLCGLGVSVVFLLALLPSRVSKRASGEWREKGRIWRGCKCRSGNNPWNLTERGESGLGLALRWELVPQDGLDSTRHKLILHRPCWAGEGVSSVCWGGKWVRWTRLQL